MKKLFVCLINVNAARAKLENCIFGKNTRIGAKADISKCITQAGYEVRAEGKSGLDDNFSPDYQKWVQML